MKQIQIDLTPEEYASETAVRRAVAQAMGVREEDLQPYRITRRSIDCRRRQVLYHCVVEVGSGECVVCSTCGPMLSTTHYPLSTKKILIIGAGPAGLFAALRALQLGMKPIIVERGKPVEERKKDIVSLVRTKEVNPTATGASAKAVPEPTATANSILAPPSVAMCHRCCASSSSMAPTPTSWSMSTHI